jgi:hypothetical protein
MRLILTEIVCSFGNNENNVIVVVVVDDDVNVNVNGVVVLL